MTVIPFLCFSPQMKRVWHSHKDGVIKNCVVNINIKTQYQIQSQREIITTA